MKTRQTATLVAITQTPIANKTEETYEFAVGDKFVKFHAHPTRAWNWVIVQGTDGKLINKVINACCEAGFNPEAMKSMVL